MKTKGQLEYEKDVKCKPVYHDGTPRKQWKDLKAIAKWSWERPKIIHHKKGEPA